MELRTLGRDGPRVSVICLGTMTFGQQNTEAEGHAQLDLAWEHGVNFLDTAELYSIPPKAETQGSTERIVGTWLKRRGKRDDVILATKVVGRTDNGWFRKDGSKSILNARHINEAIDESLKRLQTDYVDLYQLHWPDRPIAWGANPTRYEHQPEPEGGSVPIEETLGALDALVKAGKVRQVGLSNESAWGTMRFLAASEARGLPRVASVQNAYNLLNRTYETALAEIAMREQVGLLAYSPLAQGFLTGKYRGGARPAGARVTLFGRADRYTKPGSAEATDAYLALAREAGLDPAQMALAFVNSRPFVTSNIIGATTTEQLKTNLASADLTLPPDVLKGIDDIHQRFGNPAP